MMAALSGQPSCSHLMQSEMVGQGARRKTSHQTRRPHIGENAGNHESGITSMDCTASSKLDAATTVANGFKKYPRRHIYYDIVPLKSKDFNPPSSPKDIVQCCSCAKQLVGDSEISVPVKPKIPPKPKYILRDKRTRHVYQTIDLPVAVGDDIMPPPLPNKPAHCERLTEETPPPLPPRVVNEEAVRQRQKLDQEYFENLRKSVDEELLGLAEEGDLPVPVHMNNPIPVPQMQRQSDYGEHSLPLSLPPTALRETELERSNRRYSLPIYESINSESISYSSLTRPCPPALPVRANSHDSTLEGDDTITSRQSSEVNLAQNLRLLETCGWYWGNMTWQEAQELLAQKEGEGVFLMRDSQNPLHLLTITVRSTTNTIHHVRVEYSEGKFQLYEPGRTVSRSTAQCVRHSNIKQFINLAIKHSSSGSFLYFLKPKNMGDPPVQIRFLAPISRMSKVKSLKYLCRMKIRKCVVADLIPSIPLPPRIRHYLMCGPYYDQNEEI